MAVRIDFVMASDNSMTVCLQHQDKYDPELGISESIGAQHPYSSARGLST